MACKNDSDVLIGLNGWLFLKRGANNLVAYYKEKNKFNAVLVNDWHQLLNERSKIFNKKNIRYVHLFAPNKLTIYPEFSGEPLDCFSGHPINAFWQGIRYKRNNLYLKDVINPIDYFNRQKRQYLLYWKTDSHWTFQGCYCAYQLICLKLGVTPLPELIDRGSIQGELVMDLGAKLSPPVKERARFYNKLKYAERIYANSLVSYKEENGLENHIGLHVGSNVVFRNTNTTNNQKVIVFGDSFSEYRSHLLTGLLADTFRELHFVWSTALDFDYICRVDPDIVITVIVERFMPTPPQDNFNLNIYVNEKLLELNAR